MEKRLIYLHVDEICSEATNEEEKTDNLRCFWGELNELREKKYFIDRVFKKLGYFPEEIKVNEELLKNVGARNFLQEILDAEKRKNKPIK